MSFIKHTSLALLSLILLGCGDNAAPSQETEQGSFSCPTLEGDSLAFLQQQIPLLLKSKEKNRKALGDCLGSWLDLKNCKILIQSDEEGKNDFSTLEIFIQKNEAALEFEHLTELIPSANGQWRIRIHAKKASEEVVPTPSVAETPIAETKEEKPTEPVASPAPIAETPPSTQSLDLKDFPVRFQGQFEGRIRVLRLKNVRQDDNKLVFIYNLYPGSASDQNQIGFIDLQLNTFELNSIGKGKFSKVGTQYEFIFENQEKLSAD